MEGKDRSKARMQNRAARIVTTMDPAVSRWSSVFSSLVVGAHGAKFSVAFKFMVSAD